MNLRRTIKLQAARRDPRARTAEWRGAVLLEVLLALMLFAATAAIITSSMNAAMAGLERLKQNTHAVNLAATVFAELELGQRPADVGGEQAMPKPFDAWTCELATVGAETEAGEASGLTQVEVILRHKDSELVYRQMQWLKLPDATPGSSRAVTPETAGLNP